MAASPESASGGQNFDAARGLLFVHVPKTGGTAVTQALVTRRGGNEGIAADPHVCSCRLRTWPWMPNLEHLTEFYALQLIRHCVHQAPRRIVSFAVVRDPHAVRVSAWHYLRASPDWRYAPSFNEYIESGDYERLPQDQGVYGSTFARPQSSFVGPCTLLPCWQNTASTLAIHNLTRLARAPYIQRSIDMRAWGGANVPGQQDRQPNDSGICECA